MTKKQKWAIVEKGNKFDLYRRPTVGESLSRLAEHFNEFGPFLPIACTFFAIFRFADYERYLDRVWVRIGPFDTIEGLINETIELDKLASGKQTKVYKL